MFSAYVRVWDPTQTRLGDPVCFFSNVAVSPDVSIGQATLTISENAAGSFEFTITRDNVANDLIHTMTSIIYIIKDSDWEHPFWIGRVITEETDAYDRRKIGCEGTLNCLKDTYQMPKHIKCGIQSWLQYLFTLDYQDPDAPAGEVARCHDYQATYETWKQVVIAYFDPSIELDDPVDWYSDYETTWDMLKNVIEAYNLKMVVTYDSYGRINLSFYNDYPDYLQSDQVITFGRNLISFVRNWDVTDLATVIVPTGKKYKADDEARPTHPYTPPDLDAVVTIESVNQGSIELRASNDIIDRYGLIRKKVEWNDIEEPANLLDLAQDYFAKQQFDKMTMEVELYDLSLLMTGAEKAENELHLMGTVRCVSKPHGLDRYFPVTEISYDLNNPGNTKYTLGTLDNPSTLSGGVASGSISLKEEIDKNKVPESRIFNEVISRAFDDATTLMNNYANTGHVAFTKNPLDGSQLTGIVIADNVNWSAATSKLWMWNQGGLAWSEDGGRTFEGVAITNDGRISADFITAGRLDASIIRAGTLQDVTGNTNWNLETGVFKTRDYTLETISPYTPGTAGYMYLSNKIWRTGSAFATSSNTQTIAGFEAYDWRMIVGQNFGITENGTIAINEGHIGDIGIHDSYLRSTSLTLGDNDSFFLGSGDSGTLVPTDNEGTYEIAGHTRSDWHLTIGNNFGVTGGGYIYSRYGVFTEASVGGSFSAAQINANSIVGLRASMNFTVWAQEKSGTYHNRTIAIRVVRTETPGQNAWRALVYFYPLISGDDISDRLDKSVHVDFKLGWWEHYTYTQDGQSTRLGDNSSTNWYIGPIHWKSDGNPGLGLTDYTYDYFHVNGPSDHWFEADIPKTTTSSSPHSAYFYGYYESGRSHYDMSAVMIKQHIAGEMGGAARPIYTGTSEVQANGWSDTWVINVYDNAPTHGAVQINGSFIPYGNDQILGDNANFWKQAYITNIIWTSAREYKKDITPLPDDFDIFFDRLSPVQYRFKESEDEQKHCGFILDEVGTALREADVDPDDFAGYRIFDLRNPLGRGGLMYNEFIALNTWQIQKAKQRISELEERIEALERERNE